ncbi:translocation/assembly module TamB domain-containing protein [Rhodoferax sp.]|uniref:translocation/assembly module TamB domain-containing protein n=1 Tax=Rhodoferax sp. TaxID=50421 RepID=UPI0019FCFC68|nr:translocation/assembly module TamB domain-containing protein [Rhodoferax sp.]MBE0472959.1 translocation/assembly module TamB domain-containing protein [Rhodoferax sp.]
MNALRLSLKLLAAALIAVLALTAALWLWSGSDSSLATLLTRLQRFLPAGQTLEAKGVQGSLRTGGHIDWLRWRQGELSVEAKDIGVAWTLAPLLNKRLRLSELSVGSMHIDDQRSQTSAAPATPPSSLRLPIRVDVPFTLASIDLTGAVALQATAISGHYTFEDDLHRLEDGRLQVASGSYQIDTELQAVAPMALQLKLHGVVQTTLASGQQPLTVTADALLEGALASPDATLALVASLKPDAVAGPPAPTKPSEAMQADVSAQIGPWQVQPLMQANARWQALNLATLWPQAPQTRLGGEASVAPAGQGWQGKVELANALPGPWNQQRLPLDTLQAEVTFAQARWQLQALQANGAGGSITGSGQFSSGQWQGQASLRNINPAAIDTRLASAAMAGEMLATQTPQGLSFNAKLADASKQGKAGQSSPAPDSLQTLPLQSLQAEGVWAAPRLTLKTLRIDALDAHVEGQLAYNLDTQAANGQLTASLPGLQGAIDGQLAHNNGQGTLALDLSDAALASQWLKRWPAVASALQDQRLQGSARLEARWQGGWQQQGRNLRIDASLRAPELGWRNSQSSPTGQTSVPVDGRLRELQVTLSGTLPALEFSTQGQADIGTRHIDWQAQANGGLREIGHWQGSLSQFQLSAKDILRPGQWSLQTGTANQQSITLDWRASQAGNSLTVSAGSARLLGPQPGEASLSWEPVAWSQQLVKTQNATQAKAQWQSRGQIINLPLAWLDAVSSKTLADLGLSSDLILSGSWDARQTDALHLSAMLERSAGDLRVHAADGLQQDLPAEMREARLEVNLDDGYLSSSLRWDSARAGKALAAFSTQLQPQAQGWTLAKNVPIGGSLQIQLPPVDAWSALAPPGWRLRGTMDANISLSGTLDLPEWSGRLQARDLALRSVVDGIDFSQGTLNAKLHGQQIDIENFTLQGASASKGGTGGQLVMNGSIFWLPGNTETDFLSHLSMAFEVQAKALRLSSRSDLRVVVSGKVSALLKDSRLSLRGALAADQALITLPDDSAPQLGDDVIVRGLPTTMTTQPQPVSATKPGTASSSRLVSDVLVTLDLGQDFHLRGRGLDTRLAGQLSLHAIDNGPPNLTGTVRTVRGTFRAYGQRLDIEHGELRFVGAFDNPLLNILAIRPKLAQRVGVQVSGTALSPVIRLYAEPELPEAEKLAWLVLGRSASGSGGEAALLQQAALALLGGQGKGPSTSLMESLGLDELSLNSNEGDGGAAGATVTLGKRLSNDFYVAYESGLAGTMGVFTIFYDLSRNLTLRARTGEQSAVDLIWTRRYD